jgi:hypothetical protein
MGGLGSGRPVGRGKATTNDRHALDVRRLHRNGWLQPGARFDWTWKRRGKVVATIGICVEEDRVRLRYAYQHRGGTATEQDYSVRLARTPCRYGGTRPWFLCPCCARRVAILYLGNPVFACRHCWQLTYPSQKENVADRADRRANAIRKRLGWPAGIANPFGGKPKGMHWRTYQRLTNELFEWQRIAFEGYDEKMGQVRRRLASVTLLLQA